MRRTGRSMTLRVRGRTTRSARQYLQKMQAMARQKLFAYAGGAKQAPQPPVDTRHPNSKLRHGVTADTVAMPAMANEELKGYTLSYGAPATYVYTANTNGLGAELKYVTIVAQMDATGELKPALETVTDAAHLDRTPRMRLVDAVDADATNRASLLFELREQGSRQFALYRVLGPRAEQIFLTGTTQ